MNDQKQIGIIGLGWLGEPLAQELVKKGYKVKGTTTSDNKLKDFSKEPYESFKLIIEKDRVEGDWEDFIKKIDVLILTIPPRRRIENIKEIYPAQIKQIINLTPKDVKVIFISSTSVYGDYNEKVTETAECLPTKIGGEIVLSAENLLKNHYDKKVTIIRFAGLIGPQRHPGRFLAGKKEVKLANAPVNLIHLVDAIKIIEQVISQNCFGEIINGCSDSHPKKKEFYTKAAESLGLEPPVFNQETEGNFKIIDNSYSKKLLKMNYTYKNPEKIFQDE